MATDIIKNKFIESGYLNGYLISGGSSISTVSKPIYTNKEKGQNLSVINPATSNIVEKKAAFSLKFTEEFNFSTSGNYTESKNYYFFRFTQQEIRKFPFTLSNNLLFRGRSVRLVHDTLPPIE
jgi:hypothetical protein